MDYYQILNIKKDASESEIKKSYYKLARENHPDKFPEEQREEATKKFQEIGEAYEVLSDSEKRRVYDVSGKEGLQGMGNNVNPFDIFSMFGQSFNFQEQMRNQTTKNKETIFPLKVSLKDAFLGKTKKLKITKKVIVSKETKEPILEDLKRTWDRCSTCQGRGCTMVTRQIMPGMFAQTQKECSDCSGKGFILLDSFLIEEMTEIIKVEVPKGVANNQQLRIPNQGNVVPGSLPGDLLIVFNVENTEKGFIRKGSDLYFEKKILLYESLCGSSFKITHLDDRVLYVSFSSALPGERKNIKNEGINGGNLVIVFDVVFPTITKDKRKELRKILPYPQDKSRKGEKDIGYQI